MRKEQKGSVSLQRGLRSYLKNYIIILDIIMLSL